MEVDIPLSTSTLFLQLDFPSPRAPRAGRSCAAGGGGPLRKPGSHGSLTGTGAAPGHWPLA